MMEENLKIIQEIMMLGIKLNQQRRMSIELISIQQVISLPYQSVLIPIQLLIDELTRRWWVSVKNTEM